MSSITTGGKTTTYAYDADGIRTTKVVGGVTHEYLTLNGKVVYEKIGTGNTAKVMVFTYDAQGRPFAVKYSKNNGESFTNYFYALNLQGDVVKIFRPVSVKDADGNITGYTEKTYATYSYNAWGELTGITDSNGNSILNKQTTSNALANLNPLRYRGYYYDNETGFYYLQSRYYDPANRRFINADVFTSTNSTDAVACNMFAYCNNNPTARSDKRGTASKAIDLSYSDYFSEEEIISIGKNRLREIAMTATISYSKTKNDIEYWRISLDLSDCINWSYLEGLFGWDGICSILAETICDNFSKNIGREFLLSEWCVADEIEYHLQGYRYANGYSSHFNSSFALVELFGYDVAEHCRSVDIDEMDAFCGGKQRFLFNYYEGIRDCYRMTDMDPFLHYRT